MYTNVIIDGCVESSERSFLFCFNLTIYGKAMIPYLSRKAKFLCLLLVHIKIYIYSHY